jgi:hypothetical protein
LLVVQEETDSADNTLHPLEVNREGSVLEVDSLSEQVIEQIKAAWEKQMQRNSYYKINKDISIL